MTDETKHKVAKELYFFFKWFLIAGALSLILIPFFSGFFRDYVNYGYDYVTRTYDFFMPIPNPIYIPLLIIFGAYLYRLYKWVMKWK